MRKEIDGGRGLHLQDFRSLTHTKFLIRNIEQNSVNPLNSVSSLLGLFVLEVILREFLNVRYFLLQVNV